MPKVQVILVGLTTVTPVAVIVAANTVRGIRYDSFAGVLVASFLLGFLNAFLRPVLMLLSLPLLVFSLGLFTLFINAALFYLVGQIVKSFHVATFWSAFWGALIVSFVSLVANFMLGVGGHPAVRQKGFQGSRVVGRNGRNLP